MPKVLVAGRIHADGLAVLDRAGCTVRMVDEVSVESYRPHLADADGLLLRTQRLTEELVAEAPRLRIVSRHGVGYDAVDVEALNTRRIPLAIVGDVNSRTVAEHTMMMMLALAKRAVPYDIATRGGDWNSRNRFEIVELWNKTLLLIGFGRIGQLVGQLASPFGMHIVVYDPFQQEANVRAAGAVLATDLQTALAAADIVSLHLPRVDGPPLIGARELGWMKPSAILLNPSRGGLVDEAALAEALFAGRLFGAGLDVFASEPPSTNDPIFASRNALLSPHIAGLTAECASRMAQMAAQNIVDFFEGRLDSALVVNAVCPAMVGAPDLAAKAATH